MHQQTIDFSARFDGTTFDPASDQARLTNQLHRIYAVVKDGQWRTLGEIAAASGAPESSVSAQLRNLRKSKYGAHVIEKQARGDRSRGLYEYRMVAS